MARAIKGDALKNFALIGAAGYIAPRHMRAISEAGGHLVAAVDPHDSVGALDQCFPTARFFTDEALFRQFVQTRNNRDAQGPVDYVSICSPNHLHSVHTQQVLELGSSVICEKPLATTPQALEGLAKAERSSGHRVFTVLQLRLLPSLVELRRRIRKRAPGDKLDVVLTYVTRRGPWYDVSWKGDPDKSGGVAMNVGIHLFDLVLWLFGPCAHSELHLNGARRMAGFLELERANVRWLLSLEHSDLPATATRRGHAAHRSLMIDGQDIEMTGFSDLHTATYREILNGRGFCIEDARPSVELVNQLTRAAITTSSDSIHPAIWKKR